ncbi:tRNA (adenosine(37)-N6)-threonylcarbamoyltransferase complex dimerization subunit type 1 TsaB [Candidatus Bandiella euplotis]|uniref:tRNA threonylcarbamoyladenosine biosynthesis protein TsaB n=1 Tax=Candidatus Bandiella euplotis TaxID=1664265 RepID=A0ABZ0ULL7_9RICK|nr:tRNA (adenosine(37)-N6)-threonylcarbamoyltransferase complex dimerization subunit type 1 TsaB [Candidatus Bandiella woodruffii]WPX96619.1 tRNA threonylcarbamoyladenosine biosynthesis protein TsaB [Candidatus Bandiella woodruffii]
MIGLALDTSYLYASVAIIQDGKVVCVKNGEKPNEQAEVMNILIEEAMEMAELKFQDLQYTAVSTGPGRFTGLRVGISVANALCFALKTPLIPVSNFEAIAYIYQNNNQTLHDNMGIIIEAGVEKYYFQKFNKSGVISDISIISKDLVRQLKETHFLVGNTEGAHEQIQLNAVYIALYADCKTKNTTLLPSEYLKPQYILDNYI